ncbi:hypothetical protein M3Y95_00726000 [Aphelenchoides besseyi]|nr:hypothetical protein M3Y95_00726000 [Aphelenchoides besseyi]
MENTFLNFDQLERDLEDPDNLDSIHHWYQQLSEHEIDGTEPASYLVVLFRAMKWIMDYEHTAAEELKEVAEREAVEMAEKEENWEQEREILKEEISGLRERITSKAGADATNEAFRAEIDSLNAENSHLKQMGRERDRELADQRDKVEELTGKIGAFEREKNAWTTTQIQLEDTIRELNRRLTARADDMPRGEWEARKLRQRSEQALRLGEQLRNADAQNVELKQRVDSVTAALEEATALLQETTRKYEKLREQFGQTTTNAEKLMNANRDLRQTLDVKEALITDKEQTVDVSSRQTEELLRTKDAQIQRLREANQRYESELEELQTRFKMEHGDDKEREEELERLRLELVEATKLARELFGQPLESSDGKANDPTSELRVRIVHLNQELDGLRNQLKENENEQNQLNRLIETKDGQLIRSHAEIDRLRQLAFGDSTDHVKSLEKQLEFRDKQISQLTMRCSLMQLELEGITPTVVPINKPESPVVRSPQPSTIKPRKRGQSRTRSRPPIPPTDHEPQKPIDEPKSESSIEEEEDQEQITSPQKPPIINPPKTLTALQLIRLLDEEQLDDSTHDRDFLLRSLFVEFKRLSEQLNDRNLQIDTLRETMKTNERRLIEEQTKLRETEANYAHFRSEVLGSEQPIDESTLQRQIDELKIENSELNRLVSSIQIGGSEMERRFEEATRRLIHLAIQLQSNERRMINLGRRHRALSDECVQLRGRIARLQTADERRAQQLARENEMNMIEIARLQNALVHSVPARAYDRLLADFKRLLHRQTLQTIGLQPGPSDVDPGYESGIEEKQFDISMKELLSNEQSIEAMAVENRELKSVIEILEQQNDHWRRQNSLKETETRELRAFLDDLENQSDMKSMIANIERRFLQALREQTDATDEQLTSESKLKHLRRDLNTTKRQWRQDRQRLVEIVGALQLQMQRLRASTAGTLTVAQLLALQTTTDELRTKENRLTEQLNETERKIGDLDRQRALAESTRESADSMIKNNFELQNLQLNLQRVHFHSKTLANELLACQSKAQRLETQLNRATEENLELQRELNEISATAVSTDLLRIPSSPIDQSDAQQTKKRAAQSEEPKHTISAASIPLRSTDLEITTDESDTSLSASERTPRSSPIQSIQTPSRTVFVDNTADYERQIESLKETARLSIQSYKEQLQRKERALDEYKRLLESMTLTTVEAPPLIRTSGLPSDLSSSRLRSAAEIITSDENEERDRQIIALRWAINELEDANARLAEQLREAHSTSAITQLIGRDQAIQTDEPFVPSIIEANRVRDHSPESNGDSADGSTQSGDSGTVVSDEERPVATKRTNSTRTIEAASQAESQLYRERNEVRRLRSRLAAMERKNRELMNECDALRQRTKHIRDPDPNAEVNLLRRENERLRRDAKRATTKSQEQSQRLEQLEERLRRHSENVRERADNWAERKNVENEIRTLRQRLANSEGEIRDLNDKLERRDRLIEKISRGHSENAGVVDKLRSDLNASRQRETVATKSEATLKHENLVLQERLRESGAKVESALKQNNILRARLQRSTATVEVQTPEEWMKSTESQVEKTFTSEVHGSVRPKNYHSSRSFDFPSIPRLESRPTANRATNTSEETSNGNEMITTLTHQLRISELRYIEIREQMDELQEAYNQMDDEYTRFKRVRNSQNNPTSAAVTVLEDKLRGKQRELDQKRKRIEELEDALQRWQLNG